MLRTDRPRSSQRRWRTSFCPGGFRRCDHVQARSGRLAHDLLQTRVRSGEMVLTCGGEPASNSTRTRAAQMRTRRNPDLKRLNGRAPQPDGPHAASSRWPKRYMSAKPRRSSAVGRQWRVEIHLNGGRIMKGRTTASDSRAAIEGVLARDSITAAPVLAIAVRPA
jgi:hypothetical protein